MQYRLVGVISRIMDGPKKSHLMAAKRIMRCIHGPWNMVCHFQPKQNNEVVLNH